MDEYERLTRQHYGALEIKRSVGLNLIRGLVISVMLHGALISIPFVTGALQSDKQPVNAGIKGPIIVLPPLRSTPQVPIGIPRPPKPESPIIGKWMPDSVEDPIDTTTILIPIGRGGHGDPNRREYGHSYDPEDTSRDISGIEISDDPVPLETVFTPFEVPPKKLVDLCPTPEYPELARIARMKGKVTINVFVDRLGNVKKWRVLQVNPAGLGFEDEVLKVVPKWKFTPAIQQGRAVGVWVAIPVTFTYRSK